MRTPRDTNEKRGLLKVRTGSSRHTRARSLGGKRRQTLRLRSPPQTRKHSKLTER